MDSVLFVLELIGTVAFAVSGSMVAVRKNMDIFGVMILGLTTAVGGGGVRDVVLGIEPVTFLTDPIYALLSVITSLIVFLPPVRRFLGKKHRTSDFFLLIADSIGLGVFTVVGVRTAYCLSEDFGLFLLVFIGVITGVGGGILRDTFAGNTPDIFVKYFYASASVVGAFLCALLWRYLGELAAMIAGAGTVIILRILAAVFHWNLPKAS